MHYSPLAPLFVFALLLLFAFVVLLIELRIVGFVYERVGINPRLMVFMLLVSFLGSYVNIPIAQLPAEQTYSAGIVSFYGMRYVVPITRDAPGTIIAVNVGGAIVPTLLSLYLVLKNRLYISASIAVAFVSVIAHVLAQPVPGLGIAEPVFVPPVAAAGTALLLSRERAVPLAYAAGSLGTLIGADLLNLGRIRGLGAPVASIGGAGKFDGIFLAGLVAVLLASLVHARRRTRT